MIIYEQIANGEWKWDPIMVSSPCEHPISFPEKDHWDSLLDLHQIQICIYTLTNERNLLSFLTQVGFVCHHIINWKPQGLKCDPTVFWCGPPFAHSAYSRKVVRMSAKIGHCWCKGTDFIENTNCNRVIRKVSWSNSKWADTKGVP